MQNCGGRNMKVSKYFWELNPKALKETEKILKDQKHSKFIERAYTLLSRCDKPREVFNIISKRTFVESWPKIYRYWRKKGGPQDFLYWWDSIHKELLRREAIKIREASPSKYFEKIGRLIKEKRLGKGYTQKELAEKVGLKQPDISRIEKGMANITLETLFKLCKVLDIKEIPIR
jgi:DNA-binding XRE family transcriptional regulator